MRRHGVLQMTTPDAREHYWSVPPTLCRRASNKRDITLHIPYFSYYRVHTWLILWVCLLSQSARKCRTVVRVVPISIGNGTFGGPAAQKPLNRFYESASYVQGKDTSDLKLDFTYDANLASIPSSENSAEPNDDSVEPPPPITMPPNAMMHRSTAVVSASVAELMPLQSPATDDLNLKIMSVKNVWEREHPGRTPLEQIFEQRYHPLCSLPVFCHSFILQRSLLIIWCSFYPRICSVFYL